MTAQPEAYMHCFRDIVFELVQDAKESKNPNVEYHTAMLMVLGLIKSQAAAFNLDQEYLGLSNFDPEAWYAAQP